MPASQARSSAEQYDAALSVAHTCGGQPRSLRVGPRVAITSWTVAGGHLVPERAR